VVNIEPVDRNEDLLSLLTRQLDLTCHDMTLLVEHTSIMRNRTEPIGIRKKLKSFFGDSEIKLITCCNTYCFYGRPLALPAQMLARYNDSSWILFLPRTDKEWDIGNCQKLFASETLVEQLRILLEMADMCGRLWVWDNEPCFQVFFKSANPPHSIRKYLYL